MIQAPRHRHSRAYAVHDQLNALLVQFVGNLAKLQEFLSVSLSDHGGAILSKPFPNRPTLLVKVFVQCRIVMPVPLLEGF